MASRTSRPLAAAALLLAAAACSKPMPHAELRAVVLPEKDGEAVTDDRMRAMSTEVYVTLGEMGFDRREVSPIPGHRLRIVLPDSAMARLPEVRARLSAPELRLRLE